MSVKYLSSTDYACDAAAGFFEKMMTKEDARGAPTFLSTDGGSSRLTGHAVHP